MSSNVYIIPDIHNYRSIYLKRASESSDYHTPYFSYAESPTMFLSIHSLFLTYFSRYNTQRGICSPLMSKSPRDLVPLRGQGQPPTPIPLFS